MKHIARLLTVAMITATMAACVKDTPRPEPEPEPQNSNWPTAVAHDYSPSDAKKPRSMVCYDGKVYVSCGYPAAILRIDTAESRIDRILSFDSDYDLEGIAVANGKIFVASSWTTNSSGTIVYDNRIFVVDAAASGSPTSSPCPATRSAWWLWTTTTYLSPAAMATTYPQTPCLSTQAPSASPSWDAR